MARTTELIFTGEDLERMYDNLGVALAEVRKAIGYLSTWSMDSDRYVHCVITMGHDHDEFTACYYRDASTGPCGERDRPSYVIGAIWHSDHFGSHS